MNTYKLRAECWDDIQKMYEELGDDVIPFGVTIHKDKSGLPDVEAVFKSPLPWQKIIDLMLCIEDGHVMYQTIKPIEEYTGERNYKI